MAAWVVLVFILIVVPPQTDSAGVIGLQCFLGGTKELKPRCLCACCMFTLTVVVNDTSQV